MPSDAALFDLLVVDAVDARHGDYRELLGDIAQEVVTVAPGGGEALRLLGARTFGAVLVHLDSGTEEARAILVGLAGSANAFARPPVIVISAQMPDLKAIGPDAQSFDYVPSSFVRELLSARVACLLEIERLRSELDRRDERIAALGLQVELAVAAAAEEQRRSDGLKDRVGEQIHRSKNLLAIMQSVAHRTIRDGREIPEARDTLMGRLRALARAHHLITAADGKGTDIGALMEAELVDVLHRVTASGPPARLSGSVVQTFGLAIHELAVNAAKYGSLRSPEGSIAVGWTFFECGADRYLEVAWTERGGAPPKAPCGYGFGLTLVSSFASALTQSPNITFDEAGLACRMRLSQNSLLAA